LLRRKASQSNHYMREGGKGGREGGREGREGGREGGRESLYREEMQKVKIRWL
jgi:hypothetical protein